VRLVNYGPGEISDRLTILSLKVLFGTEAGKDTAHFLTERNVLLKEIAARTLNGKWFEQVIGLAAVNAALWHAEDDMRLLRRTETARHTEEAFYQDVCRVAFRIQSLNDQRAECIERINRDSGDYLGTEKV
jgi:hypothetical protein